MNDELWLEDWLPIIAEFSNDGRIFEIGCGNGRDTAVLSNAGFSVVAIDNSAAAIAEAKKIASSNCYYCQDLRAPFPAAAMDVGVVIASLSLHYFKWAETVGVFNRIYCALRSKGLLVCRVNSTNDHNFGASGFTEIEPNFYLVNGRPKRFFDQRTIEILFSDLWKVRHVSEKSIDRYELSKCVIEVVAEKSAPCRPDRGASL